MSAELFLSDGRLIALNPNRRFYTIGRAARCDICFEDRAVSNLHATLFKNDAQRWTIDDGDLGTNKPSRGGVKINGERLDPDHGQQLNHNDFVELSPTTSFRFFQIEDERTDGDTVL